MSTIVKPTCVQVFTQSMQALIGIKKNKQPLDGCEYKLVDVTRLYNELYEKRSTLQLAGMSESKCLDEEEKVLAKVGIHLPIEFEVGKHPLKDCSIPELYADTVDKWLRARDAHIDYDGADYEAHGIFEDGRYALKDEKNRDSAVCIWPKEIYAAVHAARDGGDAVADGKLSKSLPLSFVRDRGDAVADEELYQEYMTWSIDEFLERGF